MQREAQIRLGEAGFIPTEVSSISAGRLDDDALDPADGFPRAPSGSASVYPLSGMSQPLKR